MSKKSTAGQTAYYQADLKEAKAKMAQSKLEKETKKYNTHSIIAFAITSIFITVIVILSIAAPTVSGVPLLIYLMGPCIISVILGIKGIRKAKLRWPAIISLMTNILLLVVLIIIFLVMKLKDSL